jgi:hypothetical protein
MRRFVARLLIPVGLAAHVASPPAGADPVGRVHVAQKVDPDKFQKQFQDVRGGIQKDRPPATSSSDGATTNKAIIDICKQNPKLPQCKL